MADPTLVPRIPGQEMKQLKTWILGLESQSTDHHTSSHVVLPFQGLASRLSSQLSDEDVPLLMRFMHKPLRSQQELKRACDPTRRNLLLNANLGTLPDENQALVDDSMATMHLEDMNGGSEHYTELADLDRQDSGSLDRADSCEHPCRLVRKKSGEIVKPLLKDAIAALNRSRSLPLTPTYKQVHFGGDTDVRYFKQKDRPTAILAQNSPTLDGQDDDYAIADFGSSEDDSEDYGNDTPFMGILAQAPGYSSGLSMLYFDYYDDELNSHADAQKPRSFKHRNHLDRTHYPKIDWQLELLEFPRVSYQDKIMLRHMPVFLEQTFLSIDKKYLMGQIAVRNLLYEKTVTVRYTLDNWATIVEIPTVYVPDPPPILRSHDYDRFVFKILLDLLLTTFAQDDDDDRSGVLERVYELCVRFATPDSEYWDNNDNKNYLLKVRRIEQHPQSEAPKTQQMPSTARSKQQAHIKKPKYSSSYLKRILSEPSLSKRSESPKKGDITANDYNDFEQNNYYLSSPLLLSLKNKETEDELFSREPRLVHSMLEKRTPSPSSSLSHSLASIDSNSPMDEVPRDDISPNEEVPPNEHVLTAPVSPRATKHKRIDSMTYKELLESYCFFSTPSGENGSTTTLVLGDEPSIRYDQNNVLSDSRPNRSIDPDSAFTVSSFLRH